MEVRKSVRRARSPCTELWVVLPVSLYFLYWLVSVRKHCYCQHYRLGPRGASPDTSFTHLSHKVADPLICNSSISGCMLRGGAWSARSLSCTPPPPPSLPPFTLHVLVLHQDGLPPNIIEKSIGVRGEYMMIEQSIE